MVRAQGTLSMSKEGQHRRIHGRLHRITAVKDARGQIIQHLVQPLMVELHRQDFYQIAIGATILAIPVAFTEEVWKMSESLPIFNVVLIFMISIGLLSGFVYANFYRGHLPEYASTLVKRVVITYGLTALVVTTLLILMTKFPLSSDPVVALKRVVIVCLPASMSASLSDALK